jgi:SAM-dependent methyltransferase
MPSRRPHQAFTVRPNPADPCASSAAKRRLPQDDGPPGMSDARRRPSSRWPSTMLYDLRICKTRRPREAPQHEAPEHEAPEHEEPQHEGRNPFVVPEGAAGLRAAAIMARENRLAGEAGASLLRPQRGKRILEIGPGTGGALQALARRCTSIGAERSRLMCTLAHDGRPGFVVHADANRLPFASRSFDGILAMHCLMLLKPAALHEMARVLMWRGQLVARVRHPDHGGPSRGAWLDMLQRLQSVFHVKAFESSFGSWVLARPRVGPAAFRRPSAWCYARFGRALGARRPRRVDGVEVVRLHPSRPGWVARRVRATLRGLSPAERSARGLPTILAIGPEFDGAARVHAL